MNGTMNVWSFEPPSPSLGVGPSRFTPQVKGDLMKACGQRLAYPFGHAGNTLIKCRWNANRKAELNELETFGKIG